MIHPIQRFEDRFKAPLTASTQHVPRRVQAIQAMAQWKQTQHDQSDWWLRLEIGGAFQQLVCLALRDTPAVEVLPYTAEMWIVALSDLRLIEEIDRPRIKTAFGLLFRNHRIWPQPADLIANLPPRPQRAKLAAPDQTDEQRAEGAARLQDILDGLGKEREDECC